MAKEYGRVQKPADDEKMAAQMGGAATPEKLAAINAHDAQRRLADDPVAAKAMTDANKSAVADTPATPAPAPAPAARTASTGKRK